MATLDINPMAKAKAEAKIKEEARLEVGKKYKVGGYTLMLCMTDHSTYECRAFVMEGLGTGYQLQTTFVIKAQNKQLKWSVSLQELEEHYGCEIVPLK